LDLSERKFSDIIFFISLVGWNKLCLIVDNLISNFPTLKEKKLSNKSSSNVDISWMEAALVP
jgi:hypothetical protein